MLLSILKMGKRQQGADHFMKVMKICNNLDPYMPDKFKNTLLAGGLPKHLKDVMFVRRGW